MFLKKVASDAVRGMRIGLVSLALFQVVIGDALAFQAPTSPVSEAKKSKTPKATSPIKHVIVIIGENRSFDHVFATYKPKEGETVWNLLSEKIVKADGTPGRNFDKAIQRAAVDQQPDAFLLSPIKQPFPNDVLPA